VCRSYIVNSETKEQPTLSPQWTHCEICSRGFVLARCPAKLPEVRQLRLHLRAKAPTSQLAKISAQSVKLAVVHRQAPTNTNEMASANPFTDDHAERASPAADAVFHIGDGEDRDGGASIVSGTSTIELEQEPYETYQHKASQLILDLFPGYCAEDMQIERIEGGGNNRVLGVTLQKFKPKHPWYSARSILKTLQPCLTGRRPKRPNQPKRFILRIPRSPTQSMHQQVATLAYLNHTQFPHPVPKVVVCDSTAENALGQAYMLQERLSGQPLSSLYSTLNHAQRLSAIRSTSRIILDLAKVKNRCPGIVSARNTTYDLKRNIVRLEPVPIPRSQHSRSSELATPMTTREFLLDLVSRQHTHAPFPACTELWDRVNSMINTLHSLGHIPDSDAFHLHHGNLHPRNILVSVASPTEVRISGITDWDSALFAPKFLSSRAPFFAWNGELGGEEEDGNALVEPSDKGEREIKRYFEEVVGREFLEQAYRAELVLLRRLWHILLRELKNGGDISVLEEVLGEFEGLHASA
jgi:hypothetical protein